MNILILDDDIRFGKRLANMLARDIGKQQESYDIKKASTSQEARQILSDHEIHVAFLDIDLGTDQEEEGIEFLAFVRRSYAHVVCIMVTGFELSDKIERCLSLGAADYLTKPVPDNSIGYLLIKARTQHKLYRQCLQKSDLTNISLTSMLQVALTGSKSPKIMDILKQVAKLKGNDKVPIMITGETGTGKGLLTRYIWQQEKDFSRPLAELDCNQIADTLIESELFGYEKGAFSDAKTAKPGIFEMAHGGDLFIDEIGNMPIHIQQKVLRALNGTDPIRRLGAHSEKGNIYNFRLITATNENLEQMVKEKRFREDLYYRLEGIKLHIPPLRERPEDIEVLAKYFLVKNYGRNEDGQPCAYLNQSALDFCQSYTWPGNFRELERALQRAWIRAEDRCINADLLRVATNQDNRQHTQPVNRDSQKNLFVLDEARLEGRWGQNLEDLERTMISNALEKHGKITEAADFLGLSRHKLGRRIKELGVTPKKN